jgi:hypothetical protein
MSLRRALLAFSLLALPGALGGCVAAAIPVLAAGGIIARDPTPDKAGDALPPIVEVQPKGEAAAAPAVTEPLASEPATGSALTELPPAPAPGAAGTGTAVVANSSASATGTVFAAERINPYAGFYLHAAEQAQLDPVEAPRSSTILATPGSLQPVMTDCAILPPAVLIDLDPAGGQLDPARPFAPNPDLSEVLSALRLANVSVFWISGASAGDAGKVREQLLASGLDPWGRDGLLLMRRAEDRKDARRRDLAQTHCVVAIAGDTKGDFDELFDFLRNPGAAAALDGLVGAGWFLTPAPIAPKED